MKKTKEKEDGVWMRGQDEEIRVTEGGVHEERGPVDTPDEGTDPRVGGGITSLPSHPRNRAEGNGGTDGGGQRASGTTGQTPQRELVEYRKIENPKIIAQKQKIEKMNEEVDRQMAILNGMLIMDVDREDIQVNLDAMVYMVPKENIADHDE